MIEQQLDPLLATTHIGRTNLIGQLSRFGVELGFPRGELLVELRLAPCAVLAFPFQLFEPDPLLRDRYLGILQLLCQAVPRCSAFVHALFEIGYPFPDLFQLALLNFGEFAAGFLRRKRRRCQQQRE